ncbi:MAG: zinc ribbon domain-containing protein [Candidatus Hodarchaeales archaeon]|jgi:uncharacterized membrane protein YvbJ
MSKTPCPNCGTVLSEDSSFCANCGREIPELPANPTPRYTAPSREGDLTNTLVKTGDYRWPKIALLMFLLIPMLSIFGITISAMSGAISSFNNTIVIAVLGVVAIVSTLVCYAVFQRIMIEK